MGCVAHRQGNLNLSGVMQKRKHDKDEDLNEFQAFCETRELTMPDSENPGSLIITGHGVKAKGYSMKFKEAHREDADPFREPFDPVVAMPAGQGMRNGRLYIGDGSVDTLSAPSLSQLRAKSRTGSCPGIEFRPKPSLVMFREMQARLDEESRKREETEETTRQMQQTMAQQADMMTRQVEMMAQKAAAL